MVLTVYTGLSFSPTRLISGFHLKVFIYFFKYCVFLAGFCRLNRSQEQSDLKDQASRLGSEQQGAPGCSRDVPVCWRTSESHWYYRRTWLGRHVSIRSSTINKLIFLFFPLCLKEALTCHNHFHPLYSSKFQFSTVLLPAPPVSQLEVNFSLRQGEVSKHVKTLLQLFLKIAEN